MLNGRLLQGIGSIVLIKKTSSISGEKEWELIANRWDQVKFLHASIHGFQVE